MSWLSRFVSRIGGAELPEGSEVTLEPDEHVLAHAEVSGGGHLVATSLGLWLPEGRLGWHLISKAKWENGALAVIEATESATVGDAVLLVDRPVRRFPLSRPGKLPQVVRERVTDSVRSSHRRELPPSGGAWLVQRKVPGRDGMVLQVRADPGTNEQAVRTLAANVAAEIRRAVSGE